MLNNSRNNYKFNNKGFLDLDNNKYFNLIY